MSKAKWKGQRAAAKAKQGGAVNRWRSAGTSADPNLKSSHVGIECVHR